MTSVPAGGGDRASGHTSSVATPGGVVRLAFRRARAGTALTTVMVSIHQVCEATTPVLVGLALDDAISEGDVGRTFAWVGALVGVYVVLSLCGNGAMPVGYRAATRAEHDLRQAVVARTLDPRGTTERRSTGETLSIASSDCQAVGGGGDGAASASSGLVALLVATTVLMLTSVRLGLVALTCVVVVVFVVPILARPLQRRSETQQAAVAQSSGLAVDLVEGLRVLGGLGAQEAAARRYRVVSQVARHARVRAGSAEAWFGGVTTTIGGLLLVAVAAVGSFLVLDGELTPGQLVASVGLAQFLVGPVSRLAYAGAGIATVRASARRVADLLSAPYAVEDPRTARDLRLPTDLGLRADGLAGTHLHGIDLDVAPGRLVGLVCEDPAARAELLDLLARRRDPSGGRVLLGGIDLRDAPLDLVRGALAVVPHDPDLFTESLGDLVGDQPAAALAAARADEVAHVVAEHGSVHQGLTLSGGQRQRLGLARALAADPPVLVLDEPTSALDALTEAQVAAGLRDLRAGSRTTLVVTSSPSLLDAADTVAVVVDGRVVARGTHRELLADPRYASVVLS